MRSTGGWAGRFSSHPAKVALATISCRVGVTPQRSGRMDPTPGAWGARIVAADE